MSERFGLEACNVDPTRWWLTDHGVPTFLSFAPRTHAEQTVQYLNEHEEGPVDEDEVGERLAQAVSDASSESWNEGYESGYERGKADAREETVA